MRPRPIRRGAMVVLVAALLTMLLPGLALAHAELQTAVPADKSTVFGPVNEVSGVYSEAMTPNGSSLVVKDASGAIVAQGTVDADDDTRMAATPAAPLFRGTYRVESTATSLDAHTERTTWTFTVVTPEGFPSIGPTTAPSAPPSAAPTVTSSPSLSAPSPVPSAGGDTTGSSSDVLLPIIVALIVLGAGAAYLLSRRTRPPASS